MSDYLCISCFKSGNSFLEIINIFPFHFYNKNFLKENGMNKTFNHHIYNYAKPPRKPVIRAVLALVERANNISGKLCTSSTQGEED